VRPSNPNKAFEPPPGWVPPVRTQTVDTPLEQRGGAPTPAAATTSMSAPSPTPPVPASPSPAASATAATTTPPPDAVPPQTSSPVGTVYFASQSAEITDLAKADLGRIAKSLKGVRQIELRGYAGGGDPIDDRKVALARALVVRSYLIDLGVTPRAEIFNTYLTPRGDGSTEYVEVLVPGR
jgi:outer membrane protein OmpA-like peptidoglycan-associated protein